MIETVRDTLDRLKTELESRVTELRKELAPLERELAEVQRARNAIAQAAGEAPLLDFSATVEAIKWSALYSNLTMKELVLMALREQFPRGATASKLLQFFHDAWHREDIKRESLSPQLSRLKDEKRIYRIGNVWHLSNSDS
jgi:hypothetical protein